MASRIRRTLLAVGDSELQRLVGVQTVHLLSLVDERAISAQRLAELLEFRYGAEILLQPEVRSALLLALPRTEADTLAERISGNRQPQPWEYLTGLNYRPGKKPLRELYTWFELDFPAPEPEEPLPPPTVLIGPTYALYSYQNDIINRAMDALTTQDKRVLIHMPTGAGKTRSAMALLSRYLGARESSIAVWLAHSEELCDQAAEEFQRCWSAHGNRAVKLARFYGQHEVELEDLTDGPLVAGLSKLYSRSLSQQSSFLSLKRKADVIVIDEAHQAVAPTYQHLLEMLAPKGGRAALIGLSATPGRSWLDKGEDERLAEFFAHSKVELHVPGYRDPISFLQAQGYLAVPEYKPIPYTPTTQLSTSELKRLADGFDLGPDTLRRIGEDDLRNLLIVREVLPEIEAGSQIVIFACSVEHAYVLAETLKMKGASAQAISSNTPATHRRQIIDSFRSGHVQVVVNYGILTTGFDAPRTNVAVVARPTRSVVLYSQMIGRAMRGPRAGGNETCRVYTVVDRLRGFRSVSEGFAHWEDIWQQQ